MGREPDGCRMQQIEGVRMKIGNREFDVQGHTYVMEGADIIDIGGESTRPGYTLLSEEEEIARVVPVIEAVKKNFDVPVSLDTYKAKVAQEGITAGADMINDIWGLKYDGRMAAVAAASKLPCCLMHGQ